MGDAASLEAQGLGSKYFWNGSWWPGAAAAGGRQGSSWGLSSCASEQLVGCAPTCRGPLEGWPPQGPVAQKLLTICSDGADQVSCADKGIGVNSETLVYSFKTLGVNPCRSSFYLFCQ